MKEFTCQEWQVWQHSCGPSGPRRHSLHARGWYRTGRLLLVGGRSVPSGWGRWKCHENVMTSWWHSIWQSFWPCRPCHVTLFEAALTGESLPVKVPRKDDQGKPFSGRQMWSGSILKANFSEPPVTTTVLQLHTASAKNCPKLPYNSSKFQVGECQAVVSHTGVNTMIGEAAKAIQDASGKDLQMRYNMIQPVPAHSSQSHSLLIQSCQDSLKR